MIGHGENLTRPGINGYGCARCCTRLYHGALEFPVLKILQSGIEGQRDVPTGNSLSHDPNIPNSLSMEVFDIPALPTAPAQYLVVGQFQSGDALTIHIGQANDLRCHLPRRIKAAIFTLPSNARYFQSQNSTRHIGGLMACEVHESLALVQRQPLAQRRLGNLEGSCQIGDPPGIHKARRICPQCYDGGADSEGLTATIRNHATVRRYLSRPDRPHSTLLLQKGGAALLIQTLNK